MNQQRQKGGFAVRDYLHHVTSNDLIIGHFQELVIDSDRHVFLDVYADWCGPCVQARFQRKFPQAKLKRLNMAGIPC